MIGTEFVSGVYAQEMFPINVRVHKPDLDRLEMMAKAFGVPKRAVIGFCLHQGLNILEKSKGKKNGKKG